MEAKQPGQLQTSEGGLKKGGGEEGEEPKLYLTFFIS